MNLTVFGANALWDGTSIPATLYVKLHLGDPTDAGTANPATETTRKSFTRVAAAAGATSNVLVTEWLSYSVAENLTHVSIWDASSGGNCWFVDEIEDAPLLTVIGQAVEIAAGQLDMAFTTWT